MPSRPGGNYCSTCRKVVRNLSELEVDVATEVVRTAGPGTCISYSVLEDGRVAFRRQGARVALTLVTFLSACAEPAPPDLNYGPARRDDATEPGPTAALSPNEDIPEERDGPGRFEPVEATVSLHPPRSVPDVDRWPAAEHPTPEPRAALPPRPPNVRPLAGKPAPPPPPPPKPTPPPPKPEPTRGVLLRPTHLAGEMAPQPY